MSHKTQWSVYEANVQAYRGSFNATQSILLAFGALMLDSRHEWLFSIIAVLAVALIWYVWFRVIRARIFAVDYHKAFVDPAYNIPAGYQPVSEHEYQTDRAARNQFNADVGISTNWRLSRIKMDILLPAMYSLIWTILLGSIWLPRVCEYLSQG